MAIVYWAFRVMVGIAMVMLAVVVAGWALYCRGRLYDTPWYLRACQAAAPLGFLAVLAGWTTTEVGRQPWTVYGLLRTADSVTPSLTGTDVLVSLLAYVVVYLVMYPAGVIVMARLVRQGPEAPTEAVSSPVESGRPSRPIEALPQAAAAGELKPEVG